MQWFCTAHWFSDTHISIGAKPTSVSPLNFSFVSVWTIFILCVCKRGKEDKTAYYSEWATLCPTLVKPWTVARQAPLSVGFPRQESWSGLPCPAPGDLPNSGIGPRSPTPQVDSLPSESPGKPKNTAVGSLSLLQGIFLTQELNWGLLHCRWTLPVELPRKPSLCHFSNRTCSLHVSVSHFVNSNNISGPPPAKKIVTRWRLRWGLAFFFFFLAIRYL